MKSQREEARAKRERIQDMYNSEVTKLESKHGNISQQILLDWKSMHSTSGYIMAFESSSQIMIQNKFYKKLF